MRLASAPTSYYEIFLQGRPQRNARFRCLVPWSRQAWQVPPHTIGPQIAKVMFKSSDFFVLRWGARILGKCEVGPPWLCYRACVTWAVLPGPCYLGHVTWAV